jgi:hypothetical protein
MYNMECSFHYEVRLTGVRYNSKEDIEFKSKKRDFRNENPLIARQQAIDTYQDYISNILKHLGYSHKSDKESRRILEVFFEKGSTQRIPIKDFDKNLTDIMFFGIGVFFIVDTRSKSERIKIEENPELADTLFYEIPRTYLIHGIGFNGLTRPTEPEHLMNGLFFEVEEYHNFGYDLNGLTRMVEFYEYEIADSDYNEILPTPFDWTGFDVPYRNVILEPIELAWETPIEKTIVLDGESNKVEYKSTLKYNLKTKKTDPELKSKIGKTICGFLNSKGGILYIGVNDKGVPVGLESDFSLYSKDNPKDSFLKDFDNLVQTYLPKWVYNNIDVEFKALGGLDVFIVSVSPSIKKPVFFNGEKEREFYIRRTASTTKLDVADFFDHWNEHWNK